MAKLNRNQIEANLRNKIAAQYTERITIYACHNCPYYGDLMCCHNCPNF